MSPIRVHIGPMPSMLRSLVTDMLAAERDVAIVGTSNVDSPSLAAARAEGAHILITAQPSNATDAALAAIIEAQPHTIIELRPDGKSCVVVTLNRREVSLDGKSIASAIREATSA